MYSCYSSSDFFLSCNTSKEDNAKKLIAEEVKKTLIFPDSYDPIETKIDSAFSPIDDPYLIKTVVEIAQIASETAEYEEEIEQAKTTMSIFSDSYSNFGKNEYKKAKEEYDNATKIVDVAHKKAEKIAEKYKDKVNKERAFVGYKATHSYRAKNNAGQILIGKDYIYFDKDMKHIEAIIDENGLAYKIYTAALGQYVLEE